MWENGLIRKLRLSSKFMTSQLGKQTIAIHILPNISQSKDKKTMRHKDIKNITWEKFSFKNHAENEAGRLVSDIFLFFEKGLSEVKASGLHLSFNILR